MDSDNEKFLEAEFLAAEDTGIFRDRTCEHNCRRFLFSLTILFQRPPADYNSTGSSKINVRKRTTVNNCK